MKRIVGKKAPDFHVTAVSGDGEEFLDISLDTYKGHWLVLFFYPLDFTFVCPTELTSFSSEQQIFHEADAQILAVSTDSEYSHQAWIRNGLGPLRYPLGADKTMTMSRDYGVLLKKEGVALRGLFIIDPDQIIRYSVIHDNNIGRSTQEVLRVLKALQTGSLCGANWTIGSSPLKAEHAAAGSPPAFSSGEAVRIYTLPGCSYCRQIKDFLTENSIPYEEINLETDKDGQTFMEDRGYTALPVTVIGQHEISGFRLDKIRELLHKN